MMLRNFNDLLNTSQMRIPISICGKSETLKDA